MVSEGGRRCLFIINVVFQFGVVGFLIFSNFNYGWEASLSKDNFDIVTGAKSKNPTRMRRGGDEHYMRGGVWYYCLKPYTDDCKVSKLLGFADY